MSSSTLSDGIESQGLLLHGTYHYPVNVGVDASLIWGDYYFIEAMQRYLDCLISTAAWRSAYFGTQAGRFAIEYDARPDASSIDGVTGLSSGPAKTYSDLAVTARFNILGAIDARDGGGYLADVALPYLAGATYRFRLVVDIPSHRYSVYVTPPGGSPLRLALNYEFRTEQAGVASLDHWAVTASSGSHQVCNFRQLAYVPADAGWDGDVDAGDLGELLDCLSGPAVAVAGDCEHRDLDIDGDVDQDDFGLFQRCLSADGMPVELACLE